MFKSRTENTSDICLSTHTWPAYTSLPTGTILNALMCRCTHWVVIDQGAIVTRCGWGLFLRRRPTVSILILTIPGSRGCFLKFRQTYTYMYIYSFIGSWHHLLFFVCLILPLHTTSGDLKKKFKKNQTIKTWLEYKHSVINSRGFDKCIALTV